MPERRLIEINFAAAEQLGYTRETLLAPQFDLYRLFPEFDASWAALGGTESRRRYECHGVQANGRQIPI